eukprot:jgi/Bigna1/132165/aug1.16_g6873
MITKMMMKKKMVMTMVMSTLEKKQQEGRGIKNIVRIFSLARAPIFVNYLLTSFYQNYYSYAKGHSVAQLQGKSLETGKCSQYRQRRGMTYYPCEVTIGHDDVTAGSLAARSLFNDSFELVNDTFALTTDNIAWKTDKQKYHNVNSYPSICGKSAICLNESYPEIPNILDDGVRSEHFMVWNRISALPDFMKRWGKINQDIQKGTRLSFRIHANFPVSSFGGSKSLVLAKNSWIGGRNVFLGISYLVMGSLCCVTSFIFLLKQCVCPRKMGSAELLMEYEGLADDRTSSIQ